MDLAFSGGRKLRLALESPTVDRDIVAQPETTVIPPGRRSEPVALNDCGQSSFMITALVEGSDLESGSEETGTVIVERASEPYFQQQQVMQTLAITDDLTVFDITVKTAGMVRFLNNTSEDIEVTCYKQYPC